MVRRAVTVHEYHTFLGAALDQGTFPAQLAGQLECRLSMAQRDDHRVIDRHREGVTATTGGLDPWSEGVGGTDELRRDCLHGLY